jgi:MFS family permease
MQIVATGWLVLELTNSPAALGIVAGLQAVPILIFSLIGGLIADRVDRYKLQVWAQLGQMVPDVILAVVIATGQVQLWHLYAYSVVGAIISGLTSPGRQAFVPSLVPAASLLSALALSSIVWQGAAVVGPTLAGLIVAAWGVAGNFYINVVSDVVSLVVLLMMRVQVPPRAATGESNWAGFADGARYVLGSPQVRIMLISLTLLHLLARPYQQFLPVFARNIFDVGPQGLGLLLSMPSLGTILAGFGLAALHVKRPTRLFLALYAGVGLSLGAFALAPQFWMAVPLLLLVGASGSGAVTLSNTLLQQTLDDRYRGRVLSFVMVATWGSWRAAAFPIGLAAEAWGAPIAIAASAVALLAALVPMSRSRVLAPENWPTTQPVEAIVEEAEALELELR